MARARGALGREALPATTAGLSRQRRLVATCLFVLGLPALTGALLGEGARGTPATAVLLVLVLVVVTALVGGLWVALPAALVGVVVLNWFFTPPYGSLVVASPDGLLVLGVYLAVAIAVSAVVDIGVRRAAEATRARAEARALSTLAGATLAEAQTLPDLLERMRSTFHLHEVRLLEASADGEVVAARAGQEAEAGDLGEGGADDVELRLPVGDGVVLWARGPELIAEDQRVLRAFADAAGTALQGRHLAEQASRAAALTAAEEMRTALLAAVGHDLRTPLAGIKAAASSLRQRDVSFTPDEREELLETIEDSADRLRALVANLLDASRLRSGAVVVHADAVGLDEVLGRALAGLTAGERLRVHVSVPPTLPDVMIDAVLLERVVVNLVDNALRYTPAGAPVRIHAEAGDQDVVCEVVDHGPGVPASQREQLFAPFHRLGDRVPGGIGLGLSVARGFAEAMGAQLQAADTVGGGLTMRLRMHRAPSGPAPGPDL